MMRAAIAALATANVRRMPFLNKAENAQSTGKNALIADPVLQFARSKP